MDQGKHMINVQNYLNTNKILNTIQAIKLTKEIPVLANINNFCLFANYTKSLILFLSTSKRELSLLLPERTHSRAKPHLLLVPSPKPPYTSLSPISPFNTT